MRLRRGLADGSPAGPIPQAFAAPQSKVSPPHHRSQGMAGEDGFPARHPDQRQSRLVAGPIAPHRLGRAFLPPAEGKITALAKSLGIPWPRNVLCHSFISYRIAILKSADRVALEAGNSPAIIVRHYRELTTEETAKEWFGMMR